MITFQIDPSLLEIVKVIISGLTFLVSTGTLLYLILSARRNSITQTVTSERMDWIRQTREALLLFAHSYYKADRDGMIRARACLETFMRRDTPEYRRVLDHIGTCLSDKVYSPEHYDTLLGLSSYILARHWQRIKLDATRVRGSDKMLNKTVTNQVEPILTAIEQGKYTDSAYWEDASKRRKKATVSQSQSDQKGIDEKPEKA